MSHDLFHDLSLLPFHACHWATLLTLLVLTSLLPCLYALSLSSYYLIRLDCNMQISHSLT